jgi:hypothetical protein
MGKIMIEICVNVYKYLVHVMGICYVIGGGGEVS